jgi:hypothetical protein
VTTRKRRSPRAGVLGLIALALFMLFVVYNSLQVSDVRCEVCITYAGRSQCRTVDGNSREEALMAATNNVCAFLSSGVTDTMACARTPPSKVECTGDQ